MNNPKADFEMVKDLEVEGINFSISNKKLINCTFKSCNILYSGGPFDIGGCEFNDCMFLKIGPMADASNNMDAEDIKESLLKNWDTLKEFWEPNASVDDKENMNPGEIQ